TEMRVVASMHERKAVMADLSDAFLALPGAYGTADEFFEILTWAQLGMHAKPIGLLNVKGFFDPLLAWLDHTVGEGFLRERHRQLLLVGEDPEEVLDRLAAARPAPVEPKWIDDKDR
ncbi:MAG TPA: TIGR00730 family Rossman fold protein, partial [Gemmataceae bacterium]|nr:TIGR00730 family Rossman fold protein [Gemmataceae bacterium]